MRLSRIMRCVCAALGLVLHGDWPTGVLAVANPLEAAPRLELSALVREALENNPDIRAALHRWEAAKAVIPQVQTLPDPLLTLGYEKVEERAVTYGFSQEIPFPGKLRLRGEVAAREAERLEQESLAVPLRIIARLKEAFYELAFVHRSMETVEKNRLILLDFVQTAEARYAVGRGVQQDILRAQTEVSRLLGRLATLAQRQVSLQSEINRLLQRPLAAPWACHSLSRCSPCAIPWRSSTPASNRQRHSYRPSTKLSSAVTRVWRWPGASFCLTWPLASVACAMQPRGKMAIR